MIRIFFILVVVLLAFFLVRSLMQGTSGERTIDVDPVDTGRGDGDIIDVEPLDD